MIRVFRDRANDVDINCKMSQGICERIAKSLSKERPKTKEDFERVEYLKEFVLKTSKTNESTLELLKYITGLLIDISDDAKVLIEGAVFRDRLRFQSDSIEIYIEAQEKLVKDIYELKKDEISRGNKKDS